MPTAMIVEDIAGNKPHDNSIFERRDERISVLERKLCESIESSQLQAAKIQSMHLELHELRKSNEELSTENDELCNDLYDALNENEILQKKLEDSSQVLGTFESELKNVQSQNEMLEEALEYRGESPFNPEGLSNILVQMKEHMEQKLGEASKRNRQLEKRREQVTMERDVLKTEILNLLEKNHVLKRRIKKFRSKKERVGEKTEKQSKTEDKNSKIDKGLDRKRKVNKEQVEEPCFSGDLSTTKDRKESSALSGVRRNARRRSGQLTSRSRNKRTGEKTKRGRRRNSLKSYSSMQRRSMHGRTDTDLPMLENKHFWVNKFDDIMGKGEGELKVGEAHHEALDTRKLEEIRVRLLVPETASSASPQQSTKTSSCSGRKQVDEPRDSSTDFQKDPWSNLRGSYTSQDEQKGSRIERIICQASAKLQDESPSLERSLKKLMSFSSLGQMGSFAQVPAEKGKLFGDSISQVTSTTRDEPPDNLLLPFRARSA